MTDYFGFTMAAMGEGGCVFASPRKGEKNPSMILYRPFSSWASNSEVRIKHTHKSYAVSLNGKIEKGITQSHNARDFLASGQFGFYQMRKLQL